MADEKSFNYKLAYILYPKVFKDFNNLNDIVKKSLEMNAKLVEQLKLASTALDSYSKTREEGITIITQLTEQLKKCRTENVTSLENYCIKNNIKVIGNKAYKSKRKYQKFPITSYLNQYITPKSWEVAHYSYTLGRKEDNDLFTDAKIIGTGVSRDMTWTDDSNLDTSGDYYLYPEEIIVSKKGDCEDHAFLVSSLNTEIGVGYGFYKGSGHAYNVFTFNNELYVLDTTANMPYIAKLSDSPDYKLNYIITKNATFELDNSVEFGTIAGWS